MSILKDIILWKYERASWQWDVLCFLIILFIFLTPKAWFDKRERLATRTAHLVVKQADFSPDKSEMDKRIKDLSGNPNAEIIDWKERRSERGEIFFEIYIR